MGPGIKQDPQGSSSTRRDAEVARLRKELEHCNMRLSQMQTRLLATLDELDASRAAHQQELKTEKRAKEKLSEKLDRYLDEVKRAEAERDEMREVVSILVEKVERCNDYSVWPYSRMSLARPVGWSHPVLPRPTTRAHCVLNVPVAASQDPAPLIQSPRHLETDPNAIRAAILEAVSRQLAEERQAHARTKEQSDAEIFRLRAMVARRDAELEACATHAGHRVLLSTSYPADSSLGSSHPCPACAHTRRPVMEDVSGGPSRSIPAEQCHDTEPVLSQTLIQQRTLEREVEYLRHQLHEATSRPSADNIPPPPPKPHMPSSGHTRAPLTRSISSAGKVAQSSGRNTRPPPSPQLLARAGPSSPSRFDLTTGHHFDRESPDDTPLSGHTRLPAAEIARLDASPGLGLEDLKLQIDLLSTEIVAFGAERDALKRMLAEALPEGRNIPSAGDPAELESVPKHAPRQTEDDLTRRVLHHEEECARETRALRRQLEELTAERARREEALQAEIDNLRKALLDPPAAAAGGHHPRYASGDLKVPSSRAHTPTPSAPRVSAAVANPGTDLDVPAAHPRTPDASRERDEEEDGQQEVRYPAPAEDGSELDEQSMELATPLHPTILSLADDDFFLPSHTSTSMLVEPSEVPLPISPDNFDIDVPLITFSPPLAPNGYPQTSTPVRSSPPLHDEAPRIPADLLARVESMSQARVDTIEREVEEKRRELDQRTRELEEKNASLEQLHAQFSGLNSMGAAPSPSSSAPGKPPEGPDVHAESET